MQPFLAPTYSVKYVATPGQCRELPPVSSSFAWGPPTAPSERSITRRHREVFSFFTPSSRRHNAHRLWKSN